MLAEQLIQWDWVVDHADLIWSRFLQHIELTVLAVVIGLAISFPLAVFAHRHRRWYPPIAWVTGETVATIPPRDGFP